MSCTSRITCDHIQTTIINMNNIRYRKHILICSLYKYTFNLRKKSCNKSNPASATSKRLYIQRRGQHDTSLCVSRSVRKPAGPARSPALSIIGPRGTTLNSRGAGQPVNKHYSLFVIHVVHTNSIKLQYKIVRR